jgi:hypothetical protein
MTGYAFCYRLQDKTLLSKEEVLELPQNHMQKVVPNSGRVLEEMFLAVGDKVTLLPQEAQNAISEHKAYMRTVSNNFEGSVISVIDGTAVGYYLDFNPAATYNLSTPVDSDLVLASTSLMTKASINGEIEEVFYFCDKSTDLNENLSHVWDFFKKKDLPQLYTNLIYLMNQNSSQRFILSQTKNDDYIAHIMVNS